MKSIRTLATVAAIALAARTVGAQLPEAGTAGFSMGGNFTAVARGFDAVAFNPANLGLSGNPAFSLSLLAFGVSTGIDPVTLSDFKPFGGKVIPNSTKEAWLTQIGTGKERGGAEAGFSIVALSIKNLGFQVGLIGAGQVNLNQDAAEAVLFGNAGRTGTAKNFTFAGSNANGSAFAVGAVSLGIPISTGEKGDKIAFGITGKFIQGIAAGRAADDGSSVTPDNINVRFPMIYTDTNHVGDAGSGFGVDLGLSWANDKNTLSATARNVLNTFAWSTSAFMSRPGTVIFDGTKNDGSFDPQPYASAPASLRTALEDEKFKPEIAVGFAHKVSDALLLSLDGSQRIGDGIEIGPKMHVGIGAEFTGIPLLALRGGVAAITDGYQAAAGLGIHLGPIEVSAGVMTRSVNSGSSLGATFNLISIH